MCTYLIYNVYIFYFFEWREEYDVGDYCLQAGSILYNPARYLDACSAVKLRAFLLLLCAKYSLNDELGVFSGACPGRCCVLWAL